jgi:molybdenum cofactor cytidylyltransferase
VSVAGVVLAAGGSRRLGRPKQVLPYRGTTLLGATVARARGLGFDQLVVTLGVAADLVRDQVDLTGCDVVLNETAESGCASSIAAALDVVRPETKGVVLMLGDQPEVSPAAVHTLLAAGRATPVAVCRYDDGRGHPLWFAARTLGHLRVLHGDKGVWRLLESGLYPVAEAWVEGPVPRDVDTWDDYLDLIAGDVAADPDCGA